ncbi:unnamed protein product [Pedinophyceae sp. YPF-701]|nr:unnamed protein product [Pedinophyceae sp. YPF-701]
MLWLLGSAVKKESKALSLATVRKASMALTKFAARAGDASMQQMHDAVYGIRRLLERAEIQDRRGFIWQENQEDAAAALGRVAEVCAERAGETSLMIVEAALRLVTRVLEKGGEELRLSAQLQSAFGDLLAHLVEHEQAGAEQYVAAIWAAGTASAAGATLPPGTTETVKRLVQNIRNTIGTFTDRNVSETVMGIGKVFRFAEIDEDTARAVRDITGCLKDTQFRRHKQYGISVSGNVVDYLDPGILSQAIWSIGRIASTQEDAAAALWWEHGPTPEMVFDLFEALGERRMDLEAPKPIVDAVWAIGIIAECGLAYAPNGDGWVPPHRVVRALRNLLDRFLALVAQARESQPASSGSILLDGIAMFCSTGAWTLGKDDCAAVCGVFKLLSRDAVRGGGPKEWQITLRSAGRLWEDAGHAFQQASSGKLPDCADLATHVHDIAQRLLASIDVADVGERWGQLHRTFVNSRGLHPEVLAQAFGEPIRETVEECIRKIKIRSLGGNVPPH